MVVGHLLVLLLHRGWQTQPLLLHHVKIVLVLQWVLLMLLGALPDVQLQLLGELFMPLLLLLTLLLRLLLIWQLL